MRLLARALFETVDLIGRHIVVWLFIATVVACATNAAVNDDPQPTTSTGTDRTNPEYDPTPDAVPDIRPLLEDPLSPNGEPVPLRVVFGDA